MIAILWEFVVKEASIPAFEQAYGADGAWAALVGRYPGYQGTRLLRDSATTTRFLTIDHWLDDASFKRVREDSQEEYSRLDARFSQLTVSERELGVFGDA